MKELIVSTGNEVNFDFIKNVLENNKCSYVEVPLRQEDTSDVLFICREDGEFSGYKKANYISVSYIDKNNDMEEGQAVSTEYFSDMQIETAVEALKIRYRSDKPFEISNISDAFEDVFEKE